MFIWYMFILLYMYLPRTDPVFPVLNAGELGDMFMFIYLSVCALSFLRIPSVYQGIGAKSQDVAYNRYVHCIQVFSSFWVRCYHGYLSRILVVIQIHETKAYQSTSLFDNQRLQI